LTFQVTLSAEFASAANRSMVHGNTEIPGNGGVFLRNVFCGATTVPADNATLLDSYGLEPIATPPDGVCDPVEPDPESA
jgi:hypothetical protein